MKIFSISVFHVSDKSYLSISHTFSFPKAEMLQRLEMKRRWISMMEMKKWTGEDANGQQEESKTEGAED